VLVVDDSVVIRRLVAEVLSGDPEIEVVGSAANGLIALARLQSTVVDIITLDIEMPVLDGIQTLQRLRAIKNTRPVIMFSTLTEQGAAATLDALSAGAADYVTKPSNMGSITAARESVRAQLLPKIKALAGRPAHRAAAPVLPVARAEPPGADRPGRAGPPRLLAIGCSTGGPQALTTVVSALPAGFPLPVVVVQHMPPVFTRLFAERLDRQSALHVVEASAGDPVVPGTVLVAPGDFHLEVVPDPHNTGAVIARLNQAPAENFCRPAVDVLFRSVARTYGGAALAVVLTGMGSDGCLGAAEIKKLHGEVLVQDAATSVVWGMPGAIAGRGLADAVLPLGSIARTVIERAGRATPPRAPAAPAAPAAQAAPASAIGHRR
jgi:two-component system, chemotaxis family, protein-glutamate methylesterase/glutaminase